MLQALFRLCSINKIDTTLPGTALWEAFLMGVEMQSESSAAGAFFCCHGEDLALF